MQSNVVVTCTISGTCHHETDLAWVSSFNNICFNHKVGDSSQTRQFRGFNLHCENRILLFAPHTFTFPLKICQMVICHARGTYINVRMVFLFSTTKKQHLNTCCVTCYMLCVAKYSESSDRTKVFWLTCLIYQDVSFDMFIKGVNEKNPRRPCFPTC